jgi:RHS repeat-associated protein
MPGRAYTNGRQYRYGFNGKEKDNEISGEGNSYDYGARIYDAKIGRWLSVDPLQAKYVSMTPYCFTVNNPIMFMDANGMDTIRFTKNNVTYNMKSGLDGIAGVLGGLSTNSITVLQSPGKDVFYYEVQNTSIDANGISTTGKPIITEFFPNESKQSGLTQSWCRDGCLLPGNVDDLDYITLSKWASPSLVKYLESHDKSKYGSLRLDQTMTKVAEAVFSGVEIALLATPIGIAEAEGIIYERIDLTGKLKPYVGQVKNEQRFLKRMKEHARDHPNADFEFKIIDKGTPGRELDLLEQKALDKRGGPTNKSNPDGGTSNKKNIIKKTG